MVTARMFASEEAATETPPPALTVEPSMEAVTVLTMLLEATAAPTAELRAKELPLATEMEREPDPALIFDVSCASTVTPCSARRVVLRLVFPAVTVLCSLSAASTVLVIALPDPDPAPDRSKKADFPSPAPPLWFGV